VHILGKPISPKGLSILRAGTKKERQARHGSEHVKQGRMWEPFPAIMIKRDGSYGDVVWFAYPYMQKPRKAPKPVAYKRHKEELSSRIDESEALDIQYDVMLGTIVDRAPAYAADAAEWEFYRWLEDADLVLWATYNELI
jgi:hypothetical protein